MMLRRCRPSPRSSRSPPPGREVTKSPVDPPLRSARRSVRSIASSCSDDFRACNRQMISNVTTSDCCRKAVKPCKAALKFRRCAEIKRKKLQQTLADHGRLACSESHLLDTTLIHMVAQAIPFGPRSSIETCPIKTDLSVVIVC